MVEAVRRVTRRPVRPDLLEQPVARDDLVGVYQQDREQCALFRAPEMKDLLVGTNLERAE